MKLCGLTGGVGMGKSTAAGFFSRLGVRIVDTDELARELVQPGQPAVAEIREEFGEGIIGPGNGLNREKLAEWVFADAGARRKLEAILHPRIRERWQARVEAWRGENCPVAMVVIPLLFETGAEQQFDEIICAACSPAGQAERLRGRGWPPDQIRGRIAAQWPIERKLAGSRRVIWTEGSLACHRRQVELIHQQL